jgi:cobalamin 5'-phosphate synthase/cobalamin synthase
MGFWIAFQFLTVIPLPFKKDYRAGEIGSSLPFFPIVGLLIGLLVFLVNRWLGEVFSVPVAAALTLALWVWISGALHLDGLIDTCDGLAGSTPEKRLEIMADSHAGAYGITGAVILLLVKFAAVLSISGNWGWEAFVLAPVLGSWAMVAAVIRFPVRPQERRTGTGLQAGATGIQAGCRPLVITLAAAVVRAGWED